MRKNPCVKKMSGWKKVEVNFVNNLRFFLSRLELYEGSRSGLTVSVGSYLFASLKRYVEPAGIFSRKHPEEGNEKRE